MVGIFGWFKKKKRELSCKHTSGFGEEIPEAVKPIMRFSDYKSDTIGYGIRECSLCGVRLFTCICAHLMSQSKCDIIDSFINHEISLDEFKVFLEEEMAWYRMES